MSGGAFAQVGTPAELYQEPQSAFVADFMGKMNFLRGEYLGTENDRPVETAAGTVVLHVAGATVQQVDQTAGERLIHWLSDADLAFLLYVLGLAGLVFEILHPGLNVPEELAGRAVHAYEPHEYAAEVCVVGAGMAAATEWLNALAAGSTVISVRRREPARRPLNVERHYFTKRGLDGFRRTPPEERVELLRRFLEPSYPPGRAWDAPLADSRFRVEACVNGAEQVICATGFKRGFAHDPLLARLV